jgi:hypothetical protein
MERWVKGTDLSGRVIYLNMAAATEIVALTNPVLVQISIPGVGIVSVKEPVSHWIPNA